MSGRVLLLDIGPSAGSLPDTTPVAQVYASWFPVPYQPPAIPPVTELTVTPVADGILVQWTGIALAGAVYVIERSDSENGPWVEVTRTADTRYTYTDANGETSYFRVRAVVNGRSSVGVVSAPAKPAEAPSDEDLVALQLELEAERLARFEGDAKEAQDRANELAGEAQQRQQQIDAERQQREADVAAQRLRIDAIDDDEIISPVEKPQLRIDYAALIDERAGINAEADLSEATAEREAYNDALDRLIAYMQTLVDPVPWDDTSNFTYLN